VTERVLTERELNRALLARQLLLRRARLPVPRAIESVGALQAQWSPSPYVALQARLDGFEVGQLERALARKTVVKATLMRSTLHLVSTADYPIYAAAIVGARRANVERAFVVDLDAVAERLRAATAEPPRSWAEWRELMIGLAGRPVEQGIWPLWTLGFMHARLVHLPPSGSYSLTRGAHFVPLDEWTGAVPDVPRDPLRHLVRRYLAAFGPASVNDIAAWTGVPTPAIRAVLDEAPRTFRDEGGRLLYDVPRAPLPSEDTPAAVRLLPKWDSALLAYSPPERVRILPERHRKRVIANNGDVAQTILVDGFVAGTWEVKQKRLVLEPFGRLAKDVRDEIAAEGERLTAFLP
jgi:hypothetical protein